MAVLPFNPGHEYLLELGLDLLEPFTLDSSELDDPGQLLGPWEPTPSAWIDATSSLVSASVQRGSTTPEEQPSAGTLHVRLLDQTRFWDPLNTVGAHYGKLRPGRMARLSIDGTRLFVGFTGPFATALSSGVQVAAFTATDLLGQLAGETLNTDVAVATDTGAALQALLDDVSWQHGATIEAQDGQVSGVFPAGANMLDSAQTLGRSEGSPLFVSRNGELTFLDRRGQLTGNATLLTPDNTGVRYSELSTSTGSDVFTVVAVEDTSGVVAQAEDAALRSELGTNTLAVATILADTAEAQDLADFLVDLWSSETQLVREAVVLPSAAVTNQTSLFELDMTALVVLRRTWTTGSPLSAEAYYRVVGLRHDIDATRHVVTLELAPAQALVFFELDRETGRLASDSGLIPPDNRPGADIY